jgi:hypothetical protein
MDNPLLTQHRRRVAELYRAEALGLLANLSRTGLGAERAAAGVEYAFEQLAGRPDLTTRQDLTAWLTSVARNHATRLSVEKEPAMPAPARGESPDLIEALRAHPARKRRARRPKAQPRSTAQERDYYETADGQTGFGEPD